MQERNELTTEHNQDFTVFRSDQIRLAEFHLDGTPVERAREVTLLAEGVPGSLGCGVFEMERNGFSLTYPREEVMMILSGEIDVTVDGTVTRVCPGDILRVSKGLVAELNVPDHVRILYVSNPGRGEQER